MYETPLKSREKIKKIFIVLLLTLIIANISVAESKALETLPYWYSDGSKISKFNQESVTYDVTKYSGCDMTSSDLDNYVTKGESAWDDVFDITISEYDPLAHSGINIAVSCVTRTYANSQNWPGIWAGAGGVNSKTFTGSYYKPNASGVASFYTHSSGRVYLIWDSEGIGNEEKTSDYGLIEWWHTSSHEFGHAIGYLGHSTEGVSQLMYSGAGWNILPQNYDKDHMNWYIHMNREMIK